MCASRCEPVSTGIGNSFAANIFLIDSVEYSRARAQDLSESGRFRINLAIESAFRRRPEFLDGASVSTRLQRRGGYDGDRAGERIGARDFDIAMSWCDIDVSA